MERNIVLISPDVHWNTGNIGRTCLGTDTSLHLVKPLGFLLDDKHLKRAGLDYWKNVKLFVWDDFQDFLKNSKPEKEELVFFSKLGKKNYIEIPKLNRLFLVFGSETKGLPDSIIEKYQESTYYIPVKNSIRSLNLSTSVGVALYESLRGFEDFHQWK